MIFKNPNEMDAVLEKYIGQTSELKEIEKELKILVDIMNTRNKSMSSSIMAGKEYANNLATGLYLTNHKSTKKIEALFTKMFDLKYFSLSWANTATPNAVTMMPLLPIVRKLSSSNREDGTVQNDKVSIVTTINVGLVSTCQMNEREILGIILHEIGHNFYYSIFHTLSMIPFSLTDLLDPKKIPKAAITQIVNNLASGILLLDVFKLHVFINKVLKAIGKEIEKTPVYSIINRVYFVWTDINMNSALIGRYIQRFIQNKAFMQRLLSGKIKGYNPFMPISLSDIGTYNTEKHADSFAADYGYGVDLGRAQEKLVSMRSVVGASLSSAKKTSPLYTLAKDFFDVQFMFADSMFNGYPSSQNRVRSGLDRLRRSAKDDSLKPEIRKELEAQIKAYEDFYYNEYLAVTNDEDRYKVFTTSYRLVVEKVFRGKMDLRELSNFLDIYRYK